VEEKQKSNLLGFKDLVWVLSLKVIKNSEGALD